MENVTAPSSIRAGDSVTWKRELPNYPASAGWSLAYRLVPRAGGTPYDIPTTADGDDFVVALSSSDTSAWSAGDYSLVEVVTRTTERVTLQILPCAVLPDLLTAIGMDERSAAQKIVEAIDAWLSGKAGWAGEKTIGDRTIKSYPLPDLMQLRSFYAQQAASEAAAANLLSGLGVGRGRVQVRM